ncbi:MAG: hypothetical protein AMS20_05565 [Gemmatimonas sp. SG8_28]|jgi:uncharacterized OB-fold protein|nr:MAG: hypothetical protein AMS20_05565 [Gemmatimonas sp. SG8_28]
MFKWFGLVNYAPHTKVAEFATHLKDGRLVGSRCAACGAHTFPPRADCDACMSPDFTLVEVSGRGVVHTYTTISAAPSGFEQLAPYRLGLVDLEDGGRALACFGDTLADADVAIGMPVQVVPRLAEEREAITVYYTLERPGTPWPRTPLDG